MNTANIGRSFTAKYNVTKLVFYEEYGDPYTAICREKQIKGGARLLRRTAPCNDVEVMPGKKDYYDVLGVPKTASDEDIKRAFCALAHKHHPDKKGGDEAKFKEINEAYQVLSDKEKRAKYDQFGHGFEQMSGGPGRRQPVGGFGFGQGFSAGADPSGRPGWHEF